MNVGASLRLWLKNNSLIRRMHVERSEEIYVGPKDKKL